MPQTSQNPRSSSDEKLTAILGQVTRLRRRLNALALQRGLFTSLALLIGAGAAIVLVALAFGPLTFLASAILLVIALAIGLVRSIKNAWRSRVDTAATASLADRRVDFKDRLTTLVALAGRGETQLWPYLVEETLTQQQEFSVSRVERRRVSRSLYALLLSGMLAALTAILVLAPARLGLGPTVSAPRELKMPLENLQVRPADPALDPGVEVSGDPEAMQELAEREQEGADSDAPGDVGEAAKLMDKARDLASNLQSKLTGRKPAQRPKIKLRLTDEARNRLKSKNAENRQDSQAEPERLAGNGSERGGEREPNSRSGSSERGSGSDSAQRDSQAQSPPGDLASNKPIIEPSKPGSQPGNNFSNTPSEPGRGGNGGSGASHGAGADPEHLFGPAEKTPPAKDGFNITLEARLSDNGPAADGRGYVPPKVSSTLNSSQQPDEPLARAAVPPADRQTIKRVFER